jgi:transcriptional regulator with XRE-family HTH domain
MMTKTLKETLNFMKTKNKAEEYTSPAIDEIFKEISPAEFKRTEQRMLLAAKIDDAIKAKSWKKTDFAHAMKKSPSEISKWLSGTHNFTSDTLWDIGEVLGINFINIDDSPEPSYKFRPVIVYIQVPSEPEATYQSNILLADSKRIGTKSKISLTQTTNFD